MTRRADSERVGHAVTKAAKRGSAGNAALSAAPLTQPLIFPMILKSVQLLAGELLFSLRNSATVWLTERQVRFAVISTEDVTIVLGAALDALIAPQNS